MRCDPLFFYLLGAATIPAIFWIVVIASAIWEEFQDEFLWFARECSIGTVGVGAILALLIWASTVKPPELPWLDLPVTHNIVAGGAVATTTMIWTNSAGSSSTAYYCSVGTPTTSSYVVTYGPGQQMTITQSSNGSQR